MDRIAIFQASGSLQSHTINEVLEFAEADYMVDLFLCNMDWSYVGTELNNDNISIYNFRPQNIILDRDDNPSVKTDFSFYDLLRRLYKKASWLVPVWRSFFPVITWLREKYFIRLQSERGLLPESVLTKSREIIKSKKYKALIGIEKSGLIWAGIISKHLNIPYLYHSLELYTWNHPEYTKSILSRRMKMYEEKYHKNSYATIIQDKERADVLFKDNNIKNGRVIYMPVSAPDKALQRSSVFQRKFNIPDDKIIILQFGLIQKARFSLELAEIAQGFLKEWQLILHGPGDESVVEQIKKIDRKNRTIISQDVVPECDLHELISSAHIGLVLYRSFPLNDCLTAFSSEKMALQLRAGLPIIAFNYPGYDIIERTQCGILINSLDEINIAIEKILASYSEYSQNARQCFLECYEFSKNFKSIIKIINEMP
jgi:hypothetical protein